MNCTECLLTIILKSLHKSFHSFFYLNNEYISIIILFIKNIDYVNLSETMWLFFTLFVVKLSTILNEINIFI